MTVLELVQLAQAGDRTAIGELLSAYSTQAYRLALHILRNQADAEDATQNAFVKAFTNLGGFDKQRPFLPWLLRIVSHEALNFRRAANTRSRFWQLHNPVAEVEETVESIVLVREQHRELWCALNRLKAADRLVLTLSYFMDLSEAEVATTLEIKPGTVKSRKHNALVRLRTLVQDQFPGLRNEILGQLHPGGDSP